MRIRYNSLLAAAFEESNPNQEAKRANRLWWMHFLAGLVHMIQLVVVITFWGNRTLPEMVGVVQITQQITKYEKLSNTSTKNASNSHVIPGNFTMTLIQDNVFQLDIKLMIVFFFALAALDHFLVLIFSNRNTIAETGAYFRLIEYSISASIMAVSIAIETGITDLTSLSSMFFLMWSCMIFGLISETLAHSIDLTNAWIAHLAGWVPFLAAYIPIINSFIQSDRIADKNVKAPGFVIYIVWGEFFLFGCFGLVQSYYLSTKITRPNYARYTSEWIFLTLSIVAKTLLAWLVLSPLLVT
jgi:Heliorhodopsin